MDTNTVAFLITLASFALPGQTQVTVSPQQAVAEAMSSLTDPPRVKVSRLGNTRTVRHGNGQLLRGIAVPSFKYQRDQGLSAYLSDPKYWAGLKAVGINAVRLVAFDAWQRSHGDAGTKQPYPYTDLYDEKQTAEMLAEFDLIVNQAAAHGMAVMINYHDVGTYLDPDYTKPAGSDGQFPPANTWRYINRFWNLVAPRYASRSHVFYELTNEPVKWSSDDYDATDIRYLKVLFEKVRAMAPRTHIVVCSFATHYSLAGRTMLDVALDMKAAGIDFSNASLGVHPYNWNYPRANQSQTIYELMERFAVINTEQNFPAGLIDGSSDPDGSGLDGDRFGVQSMERMHTSWFHWNSGSPTEFRYNFNAYIIRDAKLKGYFWYQ